MVMTAPGLFSTITFQPSPSASAVATMRARISGGVLAEYGTTMRMTFDGKNCPSARSPAAKPTPIAAAPARNVRRSMALPLILLPVRLQRVIGESGRGGTEGGLRDRTLADVPLIE